MQVSDVSTPRVFAGDTSGWPPLLGVIIVVGALLRLLWAVTIPMDPVSDGHAYNVFAINMVEHGVYGWTPEEPGAYWPVGTSAIVAGLYTLFGQGFTPIVVLNVLLSTAVMVQVFWLGRHYFNTACGIASAAVIAVWPSLILYVSVLASDVWFIFFLLSGLIAFEARGLRFWPGVLIAGLFWAASAYVRPVALLVPLVFGAAMVLRGADGIGRTALRLVVIYALMAGAIAPWSARNEAVFGDRVLISTNFGPVFWMGNNPDTTSEYQILPDWTETVSETERADRLKAEALDYVRAEPLAFVQRTVVKFLRLHERETIAVSWNARQIEARLGTAGREALKIAASGYWYAMLLAAVWGLWRLVRDRGLWRMIVHPAFLGWMYIAWVHAVIILGDRYHIPAIPFVALLAGAGIGPALWPRGLPDLREDRA